MEIFYTEMLLNLQKISIIFTIFIIAVLTNILSSSFYNIHILKQTWSTKKFIQGLIKMIILGISTGLLAIIVATIPYILSLAGIIIAEETKNLYTITAIIALYTNGILRYYKKSFNTIKEIIEDNHITEDVEELEINFEQEEMNNV